MQTTMISAVVIFGFLLVFSGVVLGDPLKREPRTLISGRPNIDFGSCPDAKVVQDFDKDAVSEGLKIPLKWLKGCVIE